MLDFRNYLTPEQKRLHGGFLGSFFGQRQPPLTPQEQALASHPLAAPMAPKTPEQLRAEQAAVGPQLSEYKTPNPTIQTGARVPEILTTTTGVDERLIPPAAPATTVPATPEEQKKTDDFNEKLKKMIANGDFSGAVSAISKGMGGGGGAPAPPPVKFPQLSHGGSDPTAHLKGQGSQIMGKLLQERLAGGLLSGSPLLDPKKKKRKVSDRYDLLEGRR
jgi:hypothetical protein